MAILVFADPGRIEKYDEAHSLDKDDLKGFHRVGKESPGKQTVTIQLSPQALKKAKSLGKEYTSILSQILESALNDNDVIRHYL